MKRHSILAEVDQHKTVDEIMLVAKDIFALILETGLWQDQFFLHPLGFYYCRLFADDDHQIRLHIWEPNYPVKKDLFIHDHFYDLCSWVLCGKILDYTYSVEATDKISKYTMFTSSYLTDKNVRTLARTNAYHTVNKIEEKIIEKNNKYVIPRDTFHSNIILFEESDLTVTFIFTYNHKKNHSPNVIGLSSNEMYFETDPINISPSKVKILVEKAIGNIWKIK